MARKSYVTSMPDKSGTFLRATRIIARNRGNIVRVSFNKAVDLHMLFIDVEASGENLQKIEEDLLAIGYINEKITEIRVIEISVRIPDQCGALLPVLDVLDRYEINISYMNSSATGAPYQDFKLGLLIENPKIIKTLLDDISEIYPVNIIQCESSEENLDNTVFYIRLANEMGELLGLGTDRTMEFIAEANRILQVLQSEGEDAGKVFDYIRRMAYFVSSYRKERYAVSVETLCFGAATLYSIQPYCGSTTYILATTGEAVMLDTGFSIYADELLAVIYKLLPDWESRKKRVYITHADVDHCGLLYRMDDASVIVNEKSAENFRRQAAGEPDYREQTALHMGYSKISQIISGYQVPDTGKLNILDSSTPAEHGTLIKIGNMEIGGLTFEILEGSGGHLYGEMVYVCREEGILFTGDILVNIEGFSEERAEFNSLAPYLMKSVNVNPAKARKMRQEVLELVDEISAKNGKPCIVCGGHGPVSVAQDGKLVSYAAK